MPGQSVDPSPDTVWHGSDTYRVISMDALAQKCADAALDLRRPAPEQHHGAAGLRALRPIGVGSSSAFLHEFS